MVKDTPKAVLIIEKLSRGKVKSYDVWDEIPLSTHLVRIGRPSREPDAVPPDIMIVGNNYISRSQAEIFYSPENGCFMVRDNGSLNGTFLNGESLEINKPYPLKDQDLIGFAKISREIKILFRFMASEETSPPWVEEEPGRPPTKEGLYINRRTRKIFVNDKEVDLTHKEFRVLEVLYNFKGDACSIDDISWEVWREQEASNVLVAQYISRLRKKIEPEPSKPRYIVTVPGRQGCYRLNL